jgi:hypothetical protein
MNGKILLPGRKFPLRAPAVSGALFLFLILINGRAASEPLYSPTWGFRIDPPADYAYSGGDRRNTFSFTAADGASLDLAVYAEGSGRTVYASAEALANEVKRRLGSTGEISVFEYRHKPAVIMELSFSVQGGNSGPAEAMTGWGFAAELAPPQAAAGRSGGKPLLLALAYGPANRQDAQLLHLSALDSIAPAEGDRRGPGPVTEFSYPREKRTKVKLAGLDAEAWFYEEDAEAAQALVDREFRVLRRYAAGTRWKEAWARFYRIVYRDSYERLEDAAFIAERKLNVPSRENRDFANQALQWIQSFKYERNLLGSDFVNLVSAVTEGKGDCDSRAMLWALILNQANIPAAIMVSRQYSHAMGLADLPGSGAHFTMDRKQWLVAETTAAVSIGLIGENVSDISEWQGISLE